MNEQIEISARRVVTFKPSHILREKLGTGVEPAALYIAGPGHYLLPEIIE